MKKIYLDNAATTKVDENVLNAMEKIFSDKYGNASSIHLAGLEAREELENSREIIARSINASPEEIIFTSGGTESNNLALKGIVGKKKHIITTRIEHDCILNTCKWLEKQGCKITYLDVDNEGFVDLKDVENAIAKETAIVSIIHGNNEIGTLQNIEEIGKICRKHGTLFHTDACQSYTKTKIDVQKQNIDLMSLNAHKIHGPKGVGVLYVRKGIKLEPLLHGGGQEQGIRSGTENVPGIVGFAEAVKIADKKYIEYMTKLRERLIDGLLKIPNTKLNGPKNRLCNNINVSFGNVIENHSCGRRQA